MQRKRNVKSAYASSVGIPHDFCNFATVVVSLKVSIISQYKTDVGFAVQGWDCGGNPDGSVARSFGIEDGRHESRRRRIRGDSHFEYSSWRFQEPCPKNGGTVGHTVLLTGDQLN